MKNCSNSRKPAITAAVGKLEREYAKIMLLPSHSEELHDSNYEAYLDCARPESAICLPVPANARVGLGNALSEVPLLWDYSRRSHLDSTPAWTVGAKFQPEKATFSGRREFKRITKRRFASAT